MQQQARRSNRERTEATCTLLLEAARTLFLERGYAQSSTPDLVAAAGVTRGALYHHFADKRALFARVIEIEAERVAQEIEEAGGGPNPMAALLAGGEAYLKAMAVPGRARLLLVEAPAVLTREELDAIDQRHGARTLYEGVTAAMEAGQLKSLPVTVLVSCLGAAYERAALNIAEGAEAVEHSKVLQALTLGLAQ